MPKPKLKIYEKGHRPEPGERKAGMYLGTKKARKKASKELRPGAHLKILKRKHRGLD